MQTSGFVRAARKAGLTDRRLGAAAHEIALGLIDARLGGGLLKQRIAKGGKGERRGCRIIVAHRQNERLIFLYRFQNNERDNMTSQEHAALAELGRQYMRLAPDKLDEMIAAGILAEVAYDDREQEDEPDTCRSP